jgi:hypothetical protein
MDCRLVVFRIGADNNLVKKYRFAIVDISKSESYPANFVCMLPMKVDQRGGKIVNVFGTLFGDKGLDVALDMLNDALKNETDIEVKNEIERRIRLIDPKQANFIKCSGCKKIFKPHKMKKYKQNFCDNCLPQKCSQKNYPFQ